MKENKMSQSINNRYDFVYLFDVKDGNPNGDPDAGNMPRIDPDTGNGLVTDVCLKRKIRNFVALTKGEAEGFEIYVKEKAVLNAQNERAYKALGLNSKEKKGDTVEKARDWMCLNFFDIRTFGAVMSTGVNCGQVRGPVQLSFARSVDRIAPAEHSITRMAVTTEKEAEKQSGDNRTMGRKSTIPYGLYVSHGFVSAPLAAQTGFSDEDLTLLWDALKMMFEHDRSAARGLMSAQKLYVFKHDSALGSAPAGKLFERIKVALKDDSKPPRSFSDYTITVDRDDPPDGVELIEML
jgi:CRISPR-associated protein Csd2